MVASAANSVEYDYLIPQLSHHWGHCFDYLRQSLMCTADPTLEMIERDPDTDELIPQVNGWGTAHMCRDYGHVLDWALKHRVTDDDGID